MSVLDLVVDISTRGGAAAGDVADRAGTSYERMAKKVEGAGSSSEKASRRLRLSADSADNLGTKAGTATGALGALAAGFELVGLEKYQGALESASMATDFFSGVGDSLTLIMESQALATGKAKLATVAHGIATKATAASQAVLNAVMSANPIMLVVLAVIALVAIFVVAYKRSDRFRSIVQAVGRVGRQAIGWVVTKVGELVRWVATRAPAAFSRLRTVAVSVLRFITTPQRALITLVSRLVGYVRDKLPAAFATAKEKARSVASALTAPFRSLFDLIDRIRSAISKIRLPRLPSLPSLGGVFGRSSGTSSLSRMSLMSEPTMFRSSLVADSSTSSAGGSSSSSGGGFGDTFNIKVYGAVDPEGTARTIRKVVGRSSRRRAGVVFN